MKIFFSIVFTLFSFCALQSQSLIGAWETEKSVKTDSITKGFKIVFIFSKNHHVASAYDAKTGAFMATFGGSWSTNGNSISQTIEFDSQNPDRIGKTKSYEIELTANSLYLKGDNIKLKRIDSGGPGILSGAWLMSGRKRYGEFQSRDTNRPRKTMKILSGTRFQWIAYNTETKEFMGTGGGTYTTIDGKYTENIEFFSRDDSRVGASLGFDFELKDGDWHHSGFSSKGDPLYEIWSLRQ
ncbi:membrane or secreted protein [Croceitalea marina]|uniref:Membrane or secreted protein n=1 Tax=Croceitalea marina TaxID=1775166 RepID=A0ABW5MU85_9FLAO